jgi:NADH-quinone oxidoreductase subunit E
MEINLDSVDRLIDKYRGDSTAYVALLQDINKEFRHLPKAALKRAAERLEIPLSQLYSLATFYKSFKLEPGGRHEIHVCLGTACHVRGADRVLAKLCDKLGLKPGETDAGGNFSLDTVNCLGACALGPLVTVDGAYHAKVTQSSLDKLLGVYHEQDKEPA